MQIYLFYLSFSTLVALTACATTEPSTAADTTSTDSELPTVDPADTTTANNALDTETQNDRANGANKLYPNDRLFRLNHVQALGTHNSYHVAPPNTSIKDWRYTHLPLDRQLTEFGLRHFELDIHIDADGRFRVYHLPSDEGTTCTYLTDCLQVLKTWSDEHPHHHPLAVLIEPKDTYDIRYITGHYREWETDMLSVWPRERILTPDDVRGSFPTLREAVVTKGWPPLGQLRGKILFVMLDSDHHRRNYTNGHPSLEQRLMFVTSDGHEPFAAVVKLDDSTNPNLIRQAVANGFLVRTRADPPDQGTDSDRDWARRALESGAHWVSTDHPYPQPDQSLTITIPRGTPSRCNPVTAHPNCFPHDIELPR